MMNNNIIILLIKYLNIKTVKKIQKIKIMKILSPKKSS
jgi:hypothetical protein